MWMIEHAAEITARKARGNPVPKTAHQNCFARVLKIFAFFQVSISDEKIGPAFHGGHAAPNFRNQQTDIVIYPNLGTDVSCRGDKAVGSREDEIHQGIV